MTPPQEPDPQRTRALPRQEPAYSDDQYVRPAQEEVVRERVEDSYASRVRTVRMVCSAITFVVGLFAVVLVAQIILVLAEANPKNGFASFVDGFSSGVSLGFDGLFTPDSAKAAVLFNYGLAAIVWLLIGAALTYLIRRFALPGPNREVRYRRTVE
ncbi:hypothetical protein V5P93_006401 [Actinokineospora auranticolor]|uniref:Uncharacterized protein n=1 Tax=Actinokineospora auranticolor TaxID=155976 RepID=A0A2S6GFP0_9PSEU|nr:hypothetical protein [Actinokineospora auranticolor]PPK64034.1 hypothetical protein CLV40_12225 [Actinokineospora auranticolor]